MDKRISNCVETWRPNRPRQRLHRRVAVPTAGAFASVLVHTFLVVPAFLGSNPRAGSGPTAPVLTASGNDAAMTAVLLRIDTTIKRSDDLPSLTFAPAPPSDAAVSASPPEVRESPESTQSSQSASAEEAVSGDQREYALMAGRYFQQITARIERAWTRPKSPIQGGLFTCRVRVTQDRRGSIQEVSLSHCNGDQRWQQSLLTAVKTASPLPGAPDPRVFARVLRFKLSSPEYAKSASGQGFER
jgi:hypothetical protein